MTCRVSSARPTIWAAIGVLLVASAAMSCSSGSDQNKPTSSATAATTTAAPTTAPSPSTLTAQQEEWVNEADAAWNCYVQTRNELRLAPSTPDAKTQLKKCVADPLLYQAEQELKFYIDQGFSASGKGTGKVLSTSVVDDDPPTVLMTVCIDNSAVKLTDSSGAPVEVSGDGKGVSVATVKNFAATGNAFLVQELKAAADNPSC